ncbi:VanZ like family protein [Nonomuraea coxensis DSM 45129]|uniref:VanZ like family protein n=1 Tax=Nonomuraea coxensis DSM 45129 TaxID=1122611 RepID=A0ABX8UD93_9ACTN|nr:VanZ family protein [Nonomuraea coxensis]QYC45698.1 VanZ like family protein [Nonomuraea coxensis DSM 45129]
MDIFRYPLIAVHHERMAQTWELWGSVIIAGTFALFLTPFAVVLLFRRRARAGRPAPLRTAAMASPGRVAAVAAAFSVLVEVLQLALRLGRFSSVDDVLLNTAGAVIFALVTRRWWAGRIPAGSVAR